MRKRRAGTDGKEEGGARSRHGCRTGTRNWHMGRDQVAVLFFPHGREPVTRRPALVTTPLVALPLRVFVAGVIDVKHDGHDVVSAVQVLVEVLHAHGTFI